MAQLRVAIVGCGKRAHEHIIGLNADDRCRVTALVDVNQAAAKEIDQTYEFGAAIYTEHKTMLEQEQPDMVVICLWTPLHLPVFRDCAAAGVKAVISEKPMAPTWGDTLEIARLAEKSGCQLTFCHQRRFAEGNRTVRKLIEEGVFGTIERMDLYSPENLLDCGTHTFDQALSFNGEIGAQWVMGAVDMRDPKEWFGVRFESMMVGTMVFKNGVRANVQVGGPDRDMGSGVRLYGTDGFLEVDWDGQMGRGAVYSDPSWRPPQIEVDRPSHMIGVVKDAVDSLESGKEPELSHVKALRAAEIIFAFYESARSRRRVELPLVGVTDNPFIALLDGPFGKPAG